MERANNGMVSRSASGMGSMVIEPDEGYYVADEQVGMHGSAPRHVMSRSNIGQFSSGQRFTATSRLVPESHPMGGSFASQGRPIGGSVMSNNNAPYAVGGSLKRPFGDYGMLDYNFRIKFPRHTDKSRGLRHFSNKVCEKVKEKGQTNYNEVAEELVAEYFDSLPDPPSSVEKQQYDTKNIRRRVYDALNVLMAMNIIEKDKKEIHWVGLPTSSFAECRRLEEEKLQRQERLRQKTEQLQELIIQLVAYKSLVQRNRERERTYGRPADAAILYLPYIIVNTDKKTMVDCAIAPNKTEYWFNFDRPFEIHDDIEVLKRLGLAYGLDNGHVDPENVNHVKSCLPPALRDYVDQIMEGSLSGGAINRAGKGSQTVVISANQQERRPSAKFANVDSFGRQSMGGGELSGSVTYAPPMRAPAGAIGNTPMARYAVVPRSAYGNQRYLQPPPAHVQSQKTSAYAYADRSASGMTRSQYVSQSSSASHYVSGERVYGQGRAAYGSYQDYRPVQQQQQPMYGQEMQQPMEEYMEELYEEEAIEYQ